MSNLEESEGEVDLVTVRRRRGQAKAAITKMITAANVHMREYEPEGLKAALESLDLAVTRFQEIHKLYHERLVDDNDKEESEAYEKVILMSVHEVRHDALSWLQEVNTPGEVDTIDPNDPAKEAPDNRDDDNPMSAELENLRALREKEREKFELLLKRNEEEFELELQRVHHKAELDAQMLHNQQKIQAATTNLYSTPKAGKSPSTIQPSLSPISEDSISQLLELSRQQCQAQVDSLRLPPTNLIKFNGDPLQYWKFMRLFTTMVDKESVAAEEKLTRLHQYTEGKAQDAISHCLYNPNPSAGFQEAMGRLRTRFGNPHTISQAWVEKVLNFKEIRDNVQLRDFADQLRGCKDTLSAMKCEEELSGRRTLVEIISKLPPDLRSKWLNINYDITKGGRLPKLEDVVNFVETEAEKRSDPVFGSIVNYKKQEKPGNIMLPNKGSKKPYPNYSANVKAAAVQESKSTPTKRTANSKCLKCSEPHFLNQCPAFRSLTVPERLMFVQEKHLCQNCFMMGHRAEVCTRNWVCNVPGCGQKHNKWLHPNHTNKQNATASQNATGDNKTTQQNQSTQSPNVTCGFAGAGNGKVCLPIVPVVVRGKASNISSVTYALLDAGANTSLVSEELTKKLKVKGKPARLDLDTVGGSQEGIFTRCVNLEIDSLYDGNMYTLNGVRTLSKLNIGLSCLATPDEVAKWDHLADIPIPSVNSDDVHLVIGQDAPRLLRAEEYRVGRDNDPYATRTVLGWAINGPIDYEEGSKNVKAYFLKSDHSLQMQVERFWKLDDPTQRDNLSISDQKVIKEWENSVSKDGSHYILNIPFKDKAVALPNNVNLAGHRLQLLKRRLTKNADLRMKYVEAMKSTIDNGYAEEVPASFSDRDDGKVCAASFALRKCASDNAHRYDADTVSTVEKNFYVDDCLKSSDSPQQAIHLAAQLTNLLKQGGFHLTKWTSNSAEVLKSIPEQEHANHSPSLDLDRDPLMERALGVLWDIKNDQLTFSVRVKDKPSTKRGVLGTISSVYDPLGLVGPFILRGKALFQALCRIKIGWDETIPSEIAEQWGRWLDDLPTLCKLQIPRCLRPTVYIVPSVTMQLHHFSDASELGYGAVSYLRLVSHNSIYCNIIMSRNRLAPVKTTTIPRLELAAAVVAAQLDQKIRQSLELPLLDSVFWTDSTIVLHYLRNEDKRYQTFVANRVSQIREVSAASQWRYVCTECNPADDVSRGLSAEELASNERWLEGQKEELWPLQPELGSLPPEAEVKKSSQTYTVSSKVTTHSATDSFIQKYSSWYKLKRAVALILRAKDILLKKTTTKLCEPISLNDLKRAEISIIDYVQRSQITNPLRVDNLKGLVPVRLSDGLLRVGGRLNNAPIPEAAKHPVILPQKHHVCELIIWHFHKLTGLTGQQSLDDEGLMTLFCIIENIVNGRPLTKASEDPRDGQPLTPNDLLLLRPECSLPPGCFVKQDLYRRRWRQVQYMADIFWTRWMKEYLPSLQQRQKWTRHSRNYQVGDLVLVLNESTPRSQWPLGLVIDVNAGADGLVRSVQVKTRTGIYTRPIHKLCLLEGNMDG
ncbi:hypothetical protein SRHO_G00060280 [Serrasalmus rhombeus]